MEEHENLFDKIREITGGEPGRLNVLEHRIDLDLQMEYYECSWKQKQEVGEHRALERATYLSEPGYSLQVKKDILARLASIEKVECYRTIEAFARKAPPELRDWALMALNESRMLLEGEFLGENQVFISTGLGGKADKLRYFMVMMSRMHADLTGVQEKVISNEFEMTLKKYDALVEEIRFSEDMAAILLLLPMEHPLKEVLKEAIDECNRYGDFLQDDFIVTNVKTLSFEEIKEYLENKKE